MVPAALEAVNFVTFNIDLQSDFRARASLEKVLIT